MLLGPSFVGHIRLQRTSNEALRNGLWPTLDHRGIRPDDQPRELRMLVGGRFFATLKNIKNDCVRWDDYRHFLYMMRSMVLGHIYLHDWVMFGVNVGKYSSTMVRIWVWKNWKNYNLQSTKSRRSFALGRRDGDW